jgi:hypothetical protein
MAKWTVLVTYDASRTFEVDAESEEAAKEKAMEMAGLASVCHQCSNEIEVGDAIEAVEAWQ